MFNLIITIISIALVAVLAIATIYYGGTAFTQGSAKAQASTLVSHAQQITAANTLFANANGGTFSNDLTAGSRLLSENYLSSVPKHPESANAYELNTDNDVTLVVGAAADVAKICEEVNASAGLADADDVAAGFQFPATAGDVSTQYGCHQDGTNLAFIYKG